MKKVAIVTPEALSPRSFLWDELSERFKVKINNLGDNPVTQQEDGLCILGDVNNLTVGPANELGRYIFTNGVVELPHLRLEIRADSVAPLVFIPKVGITEANFQCLNDGGIYSTTVYQMEPGQITSLKLGTSCRIAYVYGEFVVVMDVFLARIKGETQFGFVDVLINARKADFPSTQDDNFNPEPPLILT